MPSSLKGMNEYQRMLETIRDACDPQANRDSKERDKDEFIAYKQLCNEMLVAVREKIRTHKNMVKKRGQSHESIALGVKIRDQLQQLDSQLPKMQQHLRKRANPSMIAWKRLSKEEVQQRYAELRVLRKQIEEARAEFDGKDTKEDDPELANITFDLQPAQPTIVGKAGGEEELRAKLFAGKKGQAAQSAAPQWNDASADEQAVLARWEQQDKAFDQQLDEIGKQVARLDPLARQIGEAAQRHNAMINELNKTADEVNDDLGAMNTRIKQLIRAEKNSTFICRIIMLITFLILAGFVLQQLQNRL